MKQNLDPYDSQRDAQLEILIRKKLDTLTERQAPASLAPRVLAAIRTRIQAPWWQRSWLTWPRSLRLALMPVLAGYAGFLIHLGGLLWQKIDFAAWGSRVAEAVLPITGTGDTLAALANAVLAMAAALLRQPAFVAGLGLCLVMYFACIGFGTLCYRLVSPRH